MFLFGSSFLMLENSVGGNAFPCKPTSKESFFHFFILLLLLFFSSSVARGVERDREETTPNQPTKSNFFGSSAKKRSFYAFLCLCEFLSTYFCSSFLLDQLILKKENTGCKEIFCPEKNAKITNSVNGKCFKWFKSQ